VGATPLAAGQRIPVPVTWILGRSCPATVVPRPVFDPGNTRLAIGR
jgi:hypothetical protein